MRRYKTFEDLIYNLSFELALCMNVLSYGIAASHKFTCSRYQGHLLWQLTSIAIKSSSILETMGRGH